jgi:methylphosphotriester-DNA--protein-cysteine methyltransferase
MLVERPSDDLLYEALVARDACYEGFAWAAVKTTGIFCRLTCPARKPNGKTPVSSRRSPNAWRPASDPAVAAGRC